MRLFKPALKAIILVALICAAIVLVRSQTTKKHESEDREIGTLNGKPLRVKNVQRNSAVASFVVKRGRAPAGAEDEKEIIAAMQRSQCDQVQGQIQLTAIADQKARLAISQPTAAQVKAFQDEYWRIHNAEAEAKKAREDAAALTAALDGVYEKGEDPEAAFQRYLAPRAYSHLAWLANLETGRTPEARRNIALPMNVTADQLIKASTAPMTRTLERRNLDDAVDREIAQRDPMFQVYLDEDRRGTKWESSFGKSVSGVSAADAAYLRAKRSDWWQARYKEVRVVLFDPSLAERCGVSH